MNKPLDVAALGEAMLEFNQTTAGQPNYLQGFGGDTSNAVIAAARAGARTAYLTRVGADAFGAELRRLWADEGVDASGVESDAAHPTGIYFVTHGPQGHEFSYLRAGSAASAMTPQWLQQPAVAAVLAGCRYLHVSGISLAISSNACDTAYAAMQAVRAAGGKTSFDANLRLKLWPLARARACVEQAIALSDVFLPSLDDAVLLCGHEAPDAIVDWGHRLGAPVVVLKLGAEGALVSDGTRRARVAPHLVRLVDATGAGDCFSGNLLARLAQGMDLFEAARHANAAAALAVQGYGAVAPLPRPDAVRSLLPSPLPLGEGEGEGMSAAAAPQLLAVDWGTSSLRGALLDAQGQVIEERAFARGILMVSAGGFPAAFDECFGDWLRAHAGLLCLMAGMVGSRQGWLEAPYCACPAGFADIAAHLAWVQPGRIAIVPGLSGERLGLAGDAALATLPDVMRGEETQVFGALRALGAQDARLVLPGTHSKWVRAQGGRITEFVTCMTGEAYALLRQHSILARTLPAEDAALDEAAFTRGVRLALQSASLLQTAFSARTLALFERMTAPELASYLSGLVIGEELRAQALTGRERVVLIGNAALTERYRLALAQCGVACDSPGAQVTWAGLHAIAHTLEIA